VGGWIQHPASSIQHPVSSIQYPVSAEMRVNLPVFRRFVLIDVKMA